jgi:hypothetical protein
MLPARRCCAKAKVMTPGMGAKSASQIERAPG